MKDYFTELVYQPVLDVYGAPVIGGMFMLLLYLQFRHPLRRWVRGVVPRLWVNVGLAVPSLIVLRLLLLPAELIAASWAADAGFGLLNLITMPRWLLLVLGFLAMDHLLYVWHWANHVVPFLWRFHNVHHTDLDLGITTAFRFHFVEMFMGVFFRSAGILLFGVPVLMVLVYEVVFQVMVAFQHSNWRLPHRLERWLVLIVITPRMHGIHHSIVERETNSNYTNVLSIWDRLYGTLRLNVPQQDIVIGVAAHQRSEDPAHTLLGSYMLPFKPQQQHMLFPDGSRPDREYVAEKERSLE